MQESSEFKNFLVHKGLICESKQKRAKKEKGTRKEQKKEISKTHPFLKNFAKKLIQISKKFPSSFPEIRKFVFFFLFCHSHLSGHNVVTYVW